MGQHHTMDSSILVGPGDGRSPNSLDVCWLVGIDVDEDVRHAKDWCSPGSQCLLIPAWSIGSEYPGYAYERANQHKYTYQDDTHNNTICSIALLCFHCLIFSLADVLRAL